MLLTKSNSTRLGDRKRTLNRTVSVGPMSLRFITLIMLAAGALFYLAQSTQSATKTYQRFELQNEKDSNIKRQEQLSSEVTRLKSLEYVKEQLKDSDLVSVDEVKN